MQKISERESTTTRIKQRRHQAKIEQESVEHEEGADISTEKFRSLVSSDLQKAKSLALAEEDPELRRQLLGILVREWAQIDPQASFDWALSLEAVRDKSISLVHIIATTAKSGNTQLAFDLLDKIPKGDLKDYAFVVSSKLLFQSNLNETLSRIESISGSGAIRAIATNLANISTHNQDYAEMKQLWDNLPHGEFRDQFELAAVTDISKTNPVAALDWLVSNTRLSNNADLLQRVALGFVQSDPDLGFQYASQIRDTRLKKAFQAQLSRSWGREDPRAAGKWLFAATSLIENPVDIEIRKGIISELVQWDYLEVENSISQIEDSSSRELSKIIALKALSKFDPKASSIELMSWGNQESEEHLKILSTSVGNWLKRSPLEGSEWIGALPAGPKKDVAVNELVLNIINYDGDYKTAKLWISQISTAEMRSFLSEKIDIASKNK